ncbi:MAG: hypothetical protein QNJ15_08295, partial [Erythrobacter sp.]|nr:hypothetical protein [Erythrobacter sp.]
MKNVVIVALSSVAMLAATPAHAGATADFAGCDGLRKPKSKDDGMRGVATIPKFSNRASTPRARIAACDRALARKELRDSQTLRKAHLLRARGSYRLEIGEAEGALEDFRAARSAATDLQGEFFFDRSMGVSLDLLEGFALAELGRWDEAAPLIEKAAAERPFAVQIQRVAALLRRTHGDAATTGGADIWADVVTIDPRSRELAERAGNAPEETDFQALREELEAEPLDLPSFPSLAGNRNVELGEVVNQWGQSHFSAATLAYAQAATGDSDAAQSTLNDIRTSLESSSQSVDEDGSTKSNPIAVLIASRTIEPRMELAEMRLAVSEGRLEDASARIREAKLEKNALTSELHSAFASANSARAEPLEPLPELRSSTRTRGSPLVELVPSLLIMPETERERIDYKKSRPNILGAIIGAGLTMGTSLLGGVGKTKGFRSEENEDGTIKVEYNGDTTSGPIVQEMTLLRAAEIARENERSHFLIEDRRDFQRYAVSTLYGIEQERRLAGYKTELDIRLIDAGEEPP